MIYCALESICSERHRKMRDRFVVPLLEFFVRHEIAAALGTPLKAFSFEKSEQIVVQFGLAYGGHTPHIPSHSLLKRLIWPSSLMEKST